MNLILPLDGYNLNQLKFSDSDKNSIHNLMIQFNDVFNKAGIESLPFFSLSNSISKLSKNDLQSLILLKNQVSDLANSILKFDQSIEYHQMLFFIDQLCPFYIEKYEDLYEKIHTKFYAKLKQSLNEIFDVSEDFVENQMKNNKIVKINIDDYINAKEFDNVFMSFINPHETLEFILSFENNFEENFNSFFKTIRQHFLLEKANIHDLIKKNNSNIFDLDQIKMTDPLAYELLRGEAFMKFCEKFNIKVLPEKNSWSAQVRPKDKIGEIFKLNTNENLIFSISTNRIPSFNLEKDTVIKDKMNLSYNVSSEQEDHKEDVVLFHKYDAETNIRLHMPIYFSYQKIALKQSQSHKSIKIID